MSFHKPKSVGGIIRITEMDQELITAKGCGIDVEGIIQINLSSVCITNKSTSTIMININNGMYVPMEAGHSIPVSTGAVESVKIKNKGATIHWLGLL